MKERKFELIIRDSCVAPELSIAEDLLIVVIGLEHDFDDILDLCGGKLENDELQMVHKLWADDNFPRRFVRAGEDLVITARD